MTSPAYELMLGLLLGGIMGFMAAGIILIVKWIIR